MKLCPHPSGVWRHRGPTSDAERRRLEPRVAAERSDAAARGEGVDARHREEGLGVARPASETVYSDPQIDHSLGSFLPNRRVLHKKAEPAPKALRASTTAAGGGASEAREARRGALVIF